MIQGTKVVTCDEMQRLEKTCGVAVEKLMDYAAKALLAVVTDWFKISDAPKKVLLLVGKGNKGGDALSLGALLLKQRYQVVALLVYPKNEMGTLCKKRLEAFTKAGGKALPFKVELEPSESLVVDGLVGTGFHGSPDETLATAITWANAQPAAILAVDIPSGVDGTTGKVENVAIQADITCCMGLPKLGCFIGDGWDHAGVVLTGDIHFPPETVAQAKPIALLLKNETLRLPHIIRSRHKYEAGYVLGIAGSPTMPGAAALASLATLRTGAGVVRLFMQEGTSEAHLPAEVMRETLHLKRIEEEQERANSLFIGPGFGRSDDKLFQKIVSLLKKPTVIDGDGLYHLSNMSRFALPAGSIITPHHGEMQRLLKAPPTLENCQKWVEKHEVTLILKGAPTILFHPKRHPLIVTAGDPGMATAGSGDVLTGMVAALLAQKLPPDQAAPLAVYLHGRAGEIAADKLTSYSVVASDLIRCVHNAIFELMNTTE